MKKILIINTGGTIAMSQDRTSGKVSPAEENPLNQDSQIFSHLAQIESQDFLHIPSPHMTLAHMEALRSNILNQARNYDGIVITHGTDTLEETAYYLDLTLNLPIPLVMTGAMRSSNEIGSDGLSNLRSAILTAACDQTVRHGLVLVMNEEIHAAAFVTKTHTTNLATFQTPTFGPVGLISKNQVVYFQSFVREDTYPACPVKSKVGLIKAYAGMEGEVFGAFQSYQGLVIEGLGVGNLPPTCLPALRKLLSLGVKIVMVSRAFNGITEDIYDYEGGGKRLADLGIIFAQGLSGVKARMKLQVLLDADMVEEIEKAFQY